MAAEAVGTPFSKGAKLEPQRGRSIWGVKPQVLLREYSVGGAEQQHKEGSGLETEAKTDPGELEDPLPGHLQVLGRGGGLGTEREGRLRGSGIKGIFPSTGKMAERVSQ